MEVWKIIYTIVALVGLYIRQFVLPNPFEFMGTMGFFINLFISGLISYVSYRIVGLIYEKNSFPLLGSILYTLTYSVITGEISLIFLCYPKMILLNLVFLVTLAVDTGAVCLIRKAKNEI